ncbi:transposase [Nocardia aobensis]|uniref:Transposase n=1 Tax=Nocardia aobensis TaxID=257277 RepID=A0ABW6PF98_9NOCA
MGVDLENAADVRRCHRPHPVAGEWGFHHRPGTSHAAGARREGDGQAEPPGGVEVEPPDHALGRSRGGWTTKTHLAFEQGRNVLSLVITAGQRADCPQFTSVLDAISVPRLGPGRARTRPDQALADKAYSSRTNRVYLRERGIKATIPVKTDQAASRKKKGSAGGRPPAFDTERYKDRHAVECGIGQLKKNRSMATRYDCDDEQVPPRVRG